ncbi:hypothetical protein LINPERPRIM_LOCUS12839 [Linum perenne]
MSTVSLELKNFINPELTWKAVAKGYRSSSRRTRKHGLRNFTVGQELLLQESKKVEDGTASDTEKHGVAILGRRFSDKIEDIPLKKRRFLLRSSSPPPKSRDESPELLKSQSKAGGDDSTKADPRQKSDDFSGLEILAAVASNNITSQVDCVQTGPVVQSIGDRVVPCAALEAPFVENDSSTKGMACEEEAMGSSLQKESGTVLSNSDTKKEIGSGKGSGSVPDGRMLWDLNVPADAWENPSDSFTVNGNVGYSIHGTKETIEVLNHSETNKECKQIQDSTKHANDSSDVKELSHEIHEADNTQNSEGSRDCFSTGNELSVSAVADTKDSSKIFGAIDSSDRSDPATVSGNDGRITVLSCDGTLAKALAPQINQLKNCDVTSPVLLSSANTTTGDPSDDSYGSDVYQTEKIYSSDVYQTEKAGLTGSGRKEELKEGGYDSQFEDGELRESDPRYYWDDNNNDGEDGEVEQVDYGSECDEGLGLTYEKEVDAERVSTPGSSNTVRNIDMDVAIDNSVSPTIRASLGVPLEKSLPSGGFVGTRARRGEFGPFGNGHPNAYSARRSTNFRNEQRDFHSKRFYGRDRGDSMQMRGRSPNRNHSGYWNSERRYSPNRPAPYGRPRQAGFVEEGRRYNMMASDRMMESNVGFENRAGRQFMRRSPPGNRNDESYDANSRMFPREMSPPARNHQFRRFTNPRGGGFREEFRNFPDEAATEYRNCNRLTNRDRTISPPLPRGRPQYSAAYQRSSRSRSRSRSRIHSPPPPPPGYLHRREMHSRSPDPSAGMNRGVRMQFRNRFPPRYDDDQRFTSPPTRRQFPPRSFDDHRGNGDLSFRGRRSPVRMYHRHPQNSNNNRFVPDDEFRPVMQTQYRRFRNDDCNNYKDRNTDGRRFELSRPRHYDPDEPPSRRRHDVDDSAVAATNMSIAADHPSTRQLRCNATEMSRSADQPSARQLRSNPIEDSAVTATEMSQPSARRLRCNAVEDSAVVANEMVRAAEDSTVKATTLVAETSSGAAAVASRCC